MKNVIILYIVIFIVGNIRNNKWIFKGYFGVFNGYFGILGGGGSLVIVVICYKFVCFFWVYVFNIMKMIFYDNK